MYSFIKKKIVTRQKSRANLQRDHSPHFEPDHDRGLESHPIKASAVSRAVSPDKDDGELFSASDVRLYRPTKPTPLSPSINKPLPPLPDVGPKVSARVKRAVAVLLGIAEMQVKLCASCELLLPFLVRNAWRAMNCCGNPICNSCFYYRFMLAVGRKPLPACSACGGDVKKPNSEMKRVIPVQETKEERVFPIKKGKDVTIKPVKKATEVKLAPLLREKKSWLNLANVGSKTWMKPMMGMRKQRVQPMKAPDLPSLREERVWSGREGQGAYKLGGWRTAGGRGGQWSYLLGERETQLCVKRVPKKKVKIQNVGWDWVWED